MSATVQLEKTMNIFFRTTILPQKDMIVSMLDRLKTFHLQFLKEYAD